MKQHKENLDLIFYIFEYEPSESMLNNILKRFLKNKNEIFEYVNTSYVSKDDIKCLFNLLLELESEDSLFDNASHLFKILVEQKKLQKHNINFIDVTTYFKDVIEKYMKLKNFDPQMSIKFFKKMKKKIIDSIYNDSIEYEISDILINNIDSEINKLQDFIHFLDYDDPFKERLFLNFMRRLMYDKSKYKNELDFCTRLDNNKFSRYKCKSKQLFKDFFNQIKISTTSFSDGVFEGVFSHIKNPNHDLKNRLYRFKNLQVRENEKETDYFCIVKYDININKSINQETLNIIKSNEYEHRIQRNDTSILFNLNENLKKF
ncbi:hypothetical protein EDEG_03240 [Edhazardia aedis USNM 41457]|uniref:Uncharacterized protein n=1 Tax=Edhazardia aedis (strain USNM 41457) TaxID=1003232 RepID=J8ZRL5_EDHAE|nr:hypothetical protein EDEG_03240 [Edhazardia aedis USNM 41457]|eukprot:EJW02338.1 hypothetical protein EDEG_03240 [Edhazardia aedis USNM 41457]